MSDANDANSPYLKIKHNLNQLQYLTPSPSTSSDLNSLDDDKFPLKINWVTKSEANSISKVINKKIFYLHRSDYTESVFGNGYFYKLTHTNAPLSNFTDESILLNQSYYSIILSKSDLELLQNDPDSRIYSAFYTEYGEITSENVDITLELYDETQNDYIQLSTPIIENPIFSIDRLFTGYAYKNWGHFLYNGGIKLQYDEEMNPNLNPSTITHYDGNIDTEVLANGGALYSSSEEIEEVANDLEDENNEFSVNDSEIRYTLYEQNNNLGYYYNETIISSFYGFSNNTLISTLGRFAEENIYDIYVEPSELLDSNSGIFLGLKQRVKSKGAATTGNIFGVSGSKSKSNSDILIEYADLNGDRYPDIITKGKILYTTMLGDYRSNSDGNNHHSKSENLDFTLGITIPGIKPTSDPQGGKIYQPSLTNSIAGINDGSGVTQNANQWVDMNGDGLKDMVNINENNITVRLNNGNSFDENVIVWGSGYSNNHNEFGLGNSLLVSSRSKTSAGIPVGLNDSFALGFGANIGDSEGVMQIIDVNGDGLPDLLLPNVNFDPLDPTSGLTPEYEYYLNTGTKFVESVDASTFTNNSRIQRSSSYGGNIFGTATDGHIFKIPIVPPPAFIPLKLVFSFSAGFNLGTSTNNASLGDINGDGLVDVLNDAPFAISANLNSVGKTHLLKKVNTPLGGSWEIDYVRNGNTYKLPQSKWVLDEIRTDDNFHGDSNYTEDRTLTKVTYENPNYDRREREFLGYQGVKVEQLKPDDNSTYRYTVKSYLNDNYYLKGAEYSSALYNNVDELLTEKETFYTLMDAEAPEVDLNFPNNYYNTQSITEEELDKSRLFLSVAKVRTTNYESNGTGLSAEKHFTEYDTHGNIKEYVDIGEGGSDSYRTEITYENPLSGLENAFAYPNVISVRQEDNDNLLRQREAQYSNNGNLIQVTTQLNQDDQNQVQLNYDSYGNLTQIIQLDNLGLNGTPYNQQINYDQDFHTYPVSFNNAFGESSSMDYDYMFGIPITTTDMNGYSMRTRIDDRGRIVEVTGPNELALESLGSNSEPGWTIRYEYENEALVSGLVENLNSDEYVVNAQNSFTSNSGVTEHYAVTRHFDPAYAAENSTTSSNQLLTISIVDGFGKAVQLKKSHYEGSADSGTIEWQVSGQEEKDAFGRVTKAYLPKIEGGYPSNLSSLSGSTNFTAYNSLSAPENVPPTEILYDHRDRKVSVQAPDSSLEEFSYTVDSDRLITTYTNGRGFQTETFNDNRGRTRKTIQHGSDDDMTVEYLYNAINELLEVKTNGQDNQTTYSKYDLAGRRIEYKHPDQGATVFEYDNAGNLLKRRTSNLLTAGNQQAIEYIYDYGRLMEINYPENPENNVKYTYGETNDPLAEEVNAVGRVLYQEDASGIQLFGYGKMGELTKNLRSVDVAGRHSYFFYTAWEYDSWNRVQKITYPDAEEVTYHYNLGGELQSITSEIEGLSTSDPQPDIIQDIEYNGFGERVRIEYGNGTATDFQYDSNRRMENLHHFFANNFQIAKTYAYDNNSNVESINTDSGTNGLSLNGELSGPANYTFVYDGFDRLTHAEGIYTGPNDLPTDDYLQQKYVLDMEYDTQNSHTILSKKQTHQFGTVTGPGDPMNNIQTNFETNYSLSYEDYGQAAEVSGSGFGYIQPHAPTKIVQKPDDNCCGNADDPRIETKLIEYDPNGNLLEIKKEVGEEQFSLRKNLWDEENRLAAVDLNPEGNKNRPVAIYTYDAGGERIIKYNINRIEAYSNAKDQGHTKENNTVIYPSGLITARPNSDEKREKFIEYTKHYYAGAQRVSSKTGTLNDLGRFPANVSQNIITNLNANDFADTGDQGVIESQGKISSIYTSFGLIAPIFQTPAVANTSLEPINYTHTLENDEELEVFYFHPDHLGSSNFITNIYGQISQHMEYTAFGEILVDEHLNSNNSPFKFNAKELDEETGNYYYGARYYDPKWSIWLSVDPMAEIYPNISPYSYTMNNPVRYTDPTGMVVQDGPGDGETEESSTNDKIHKGSGTIADGETFNELDEIIIGVVITGDAQGAHVDKSTDQFYGFKTEGQIQTQNVDLYGEFSGFSFGYQDKSESNVIAGNISGYGLNAKFGKNIKNLPLGLENWTSEFEGNIFKGQLNGALGIYSGGTDKRGLIIQAGGGVAAADYEVRTAVTLPFFGGIRVGITRGQSFGTANAGFNLSAVKDETGSVNIAGALQWGWITGKKFGFDISTTSINN